MYLKRHEFQSLLREKLLANLKTIHRATKPASSVHRLKRAIKEALASILDLSFYPQIGLVSSTNPYWVNLEAFSSTFNWLDDNYSKNLMVEILARRVLRGGAQWLPPIRQFESQEMLANNAVMRSNVQLVAANQLNMMLSEFNLSQLGYDIQADLHTLNVICTFLLEQYRYHQQDTDIGIQPGDIVIDAGGCWGDTALYMAAKGAEHIFSFEFVEENLAVFRRNLATNPHLASKVTIVENALWDASEKKLAFDSAGPGTRASEDHGSQAVDTISIDDFVSQRGLRRVDFIKMDIEGAEANALLGAKNTLKKYAPRLAIAVYHRPEDLAVIPQIIKQMQPAYNLYLDHYMPNLWETVLFATVR